MEVIEESGESVRGLELKWGNKMGGGGKGLEEGYGYGEFDVVNGENYLELV